MKNIAHQEAASSLPNSDQARNQTDWSRFYTATVYHHQTSGSSYQLFHFKSGQGIKLVGQDVLCKPLSGTSKYLLIVPYYVKNPQLLRLEGRIYWLYQCPLSHVGICMTLFKDKVFKVSNYSTILNIFQEKKML